VLAARASAAKKKSSETTADAGLHGRPPGNAAATQKSWTGSGSARQSVVADRRRRRNSSDGDGSLDDIGSGALSVRASVVASAECELCDEIGVLKLRCDGYIYSGSLERACKCQRS
jgi:hypothetical protein